MDKSSSKITGLSATKTFGKPRDGKQAITGLKFKGSDVDTSVPAMGGNAPSRSKTTALKSKKT